MTDIKCAALWNETQWWSAPGFFGGWFSDSITTLFQFNNKPIKLSLFILRLWKLPLLQFTLCHGCFRISQFNLPGKWRCSGGNSGFIDILFFFYMISITAVALIYLQLSLLLLSGIRKKRESPFLICVRIGVAPLKTNLYRENNSDMKPW